MQHGLYRQIFSRQISKSRAALSIKGLVLVFLIVGCSAAHHSTHIPSDRAVSVNSPGGKRYHEKVIALQTDLTDLNRQADMLEARQVAETAITYSGNLAQDYNLVRPAILHNVFVRIGLKDRGLCYHWTEDLIRRLQSLELKTFQLHWGVAYRGSELREHNSVVITARGDAFEKGMVLDPWRNSGDLYWTLISADRYPWKVLPPEEW
ncbi:MAG: hypothetical protein PVI13_06795 [Desulfobacterales bacterium]|jgi:hypothetical protein